MRTNHWLSTMLVGLMLAMMLTAVSAAGERASGPPRYQGSINSEQDLLATFAAGLVGDALGYDANEVLDAVNETGMPVEDILPTFMTAYLSGRTYVNVVERRTEGDRWGEILNRFKVEEGDLEELAIPRDVEVTDLRSLPDQVIEDLLMCAALSEVFDLDPDEVYEYYQEGWTATDVLAAAELAYRSRQTMSELLRGKGIRVDWYREARSLEVDLREVARENGRCFDNETPVISEEPRRGDLEVTYSADVAVRTYSIPLRVVQQLRFRYLLSPSEVLQVLYVSRSCGRDYWDVARIYSWDHWHAWAPALVALRLPITHFRGLSIWDELPMDYYAIDPWRLDSILLGCSLSLGGAFEFDFYWSTFDPWYRPWDPILYCGMHWRHGWGWSDYYNWRRAPHPWRGHPDIGRDWGDWNRSRDWNGHRVVGVVVGDHRQPGHPRQSWDRPPRTWDRAYGGDGRPQIVNRDGRVEYGQYPGMTLRKGGRGDRPATPGKGGIEFGERVGHGNGPQPGGGPQGKPNTGPRDDRPTIGTSRPGGPRVEYGEPRIGSGPKTGPNSQPRSGSGDAPVYRPGGPQGNGPRSGQPNISGRVSQPRSNDGRHTPRVVGPQNPPQGQPQGPGAGPGAGNRQQERHQERRGNGGGSVGPGPGSGGGGGNGGGGPQGQPQGGGPQGNRQDGDGERGGRGGNGGGGPHVSGDGGGGGNGGGGHQGGGGGGGPRGGGGGGGRQGGGGGGRHGDVSGR